MNILDKAIDKLTGFLTFLTGDHRYIHEGLAFVYSSSTGSLAESAAYSISIKTPPKTSGIKIHFRPTSIVSTANTLRTLLNEGTTVSSGAAVEMINLNRNSTNKSKATVLVGATSTGGTQIAQHVIGGGSNPSSAAGGNTESNAERVLKPDTQYTITFTNIGASTATVCYYELFWYEEY